MVPVAVGEGDGFKVLRVKLQAVHVVDEALRGKPRIEKQPVRFVAPPHSDETGKAMLGLQGYPHGRLLQERVVGQPGGPWPAMDFLVAIEEGVDLVVDKDGDLNGVGLEQRQRRHASLL